MTSQSDDGVSFALEVLIAANPPIVETLRTGARHLLQERGSRYRSYKTHVTELEMRLLSTLKAHGVNVQSRDQMLAALYRLSEFD